MQIERKLEVCSLVDLHIKQAKHQHLVLNFEILEGIIGIFTFHRCYVHLCH
jgi:hypothetical protein